MSGYYPRKAPNVSQYIANLNTIPSPQDATSQQQDGYPLDDDLAIFTNAEFFDYDLGTNIDRSSVAFDSARSRRGSVERKADSGPKGLNFDAAAFQFPDLPYAPLDHTTGFPPPIQTDYPASFGIGSGPSPTSPYNVTALPNTGDKRPYSATSMSPGAQSFEATSRAAAEEDKRRRNTAASARFRVKKKQREQALEKTAKEMTDRADALEARIAQLEMENKWLRNLVVEKTAKGKEDVAELWKRFSQENDGRSSDKTKKGVGTEKDDSKKDEVEA